MHVRNEEAERGTNCWKFGPIGTIRRSEKASREVSRNFYNLVGAQVSRIKSRDRKSSGTFKQILFEMDRGTFF